MAFQRGGGVGVVGGLAKLKVKESNLIITLM